MVKLKFRELSVNFRDRLSAKSLNPRTFFKQNKCHFPKKNKKISKIAISLIIRDLKIKAEKTFHSKKISKVTKNGS